MEGLPEVGEGAGAVVVVTGGGAEGEMAVLVSVLVEVVAVVMMARSVTLGSGALEIMAFVLALFPALGLFSSLVEP